MQHVPRHVQVEFVFAFDVDVLKATAELTSLD